MKIIFDKLLQTKQVVEGATVEEVKKIVDDEIDTGQELTFIAYDNTRQALNKRIADVAFPSIRVSSSNIQGIIETPVILTPINNSYISRYHFFIKSSEFEATNGLRETHKSSLWQVARDPDFQVLVYERESIVFKTSITIPKKFFEFNEIYYIRVKYKGKKYQSNWSNIVKVITQNILIEKPVIYTPSNNEVIFNTIHLTSSPFITIPHDEAQHKSSLWQMSEDIDFNVLEWEYNTSTFLRDVYVPPINILRGRDYYLRVQYIADNNDKSIFSDPVKVFSDYKIMKPSILLPINDTYINRHEFNVKGSDFQTFPSSTAKLFAYEIKLTKSTNEEDVVYFKKISANKCEHLVPKEELNFDTPYKIFIKYYGEYSESEWSDPVIVRTNKINYKTPVILTPKEDSYFSPILLNINCSRFETVPLFDDVHKETIYQISESFEFDRKVIDLRSDTNLTFLTVSQPSLFKPNTPYFMKVKYIGAKGESSWSAIRKINSFNLSVPLKPVLTIKEKSDIDFGSDIEKSIGTLTTDILLNDPGDQIVWSKWIVSKTPDFSSFNEEKIETSHPKEIAVSLNSSLFTTDNIFYVKVAFKTIINQNYTNYSEALRLPIGKALKPVIDSYEFTCPSIYENKLIINGSKIDGPNDFNEALLFAEIEMSELEDFNKVILKFPNPSETFTIQNSPLLKNIRYLRLKYNGYYFGESDYSDTVSIDFGHIEKPRILEHVVTNTELNETALFTSVLLDASDFIVTQNRKDVHRFSRWHIYADNQRSTLILSSDWMIDDSTLYEFEVDLETYNKVYVDVTYGSNYLGESEKSDLYEVILDPYIFTPIFLTPYADEELLKENVSLSVKNFISKPDITHTSTYWFITDDEAGNNIIWEEDSTNNLTSISVPNNILESGKTYYAHVKFKSAQYSSKLTSLVFKTKAVGSVIINIQPEEVITDGAKWRIVGTDIWHDSGYTLNEIVIGDYQIEFKNLLPKWKEKSIVDVTIIAGETITLTEAYEINGGTLQVIFKPQPVIDGGCKWRRVGTTEWFDSGYSEIGVLSGNYTVELFTPDVNLYLLPTPMEVVIVNAELTILEVEFVIVGTPGITMEELKLNFPVVASGRKRIPPTTVTATIENGEGVIEPLSQTIPYRTSTTFSVVGGFKIKNNNESIIESTTIP